MHRMRRLYRGLSPRRNFQDRGLGWEDPARDRGIKPTLSDVYRYPVRAGLPGERSDQARKPRTDQNRYRPGQPDDLCDLQGADLRPLLQGLPLPPLGPDDDRRQTPRRQRGVYRVRAVRTSLPRPTPRHRRHPGASFGSRLESPQRGSTGGVKAEPETSSASKVDSGSAAVSRQLSAVSRTARSNSSDRIQRTSSSPSNRHQWHSKRRLRAES